MSIPPTHLLPLLLLVAACLSVEAVVVPLGASEATPGQLAQACIGQGSERVCYPLATGGRQYVQCGGQAPTVGECPRGTRFDYVKRACIRASYAQPCPTWNCPLVPAGAALSPIYGQFGVPGNLTIPLWKKETFTVYCPVNGHCLGGMVFNIHVDCPAPADRYPFTFEVDYEERVFNDQLYPKRQADLYAFCGDSVFIEWDEPIHLVQLFNTSAAAAPLWNGQLITPYPPQPVYQCPVWPAGPPEGFPIPFPEETVIMPVIAGPQNATWTATMPETFFFVCPLGNHCRLGMIFKATVVAAPSGYTPVHSTIQWVITSDNYPDLTLNVGDSITFVVPPSPPMAHGLYKTPTSLIKVL